jgi:hypothetical protein
LDTWVVRHVANRLTQAAARLSRKPIEFAQTRTLQASAGLGFRPPLCLKLLPETAPVPVPAAPVPPRRPPHVVRPASDVPGFRLPGGIGGPTADPPRSALKQTALRHADDRRTSDDQVVQHTDIH